MKTSTTPNHKESCVLSGVLLNKVFKGTKFSKFLRNCCFLLKMVLHEKFHH